MIERFGVDPAEMLERTSVRVTLGLAAAYSVLYWVPGSPLPDRMPWGVITQGIIFGTSNALLAFGLILIYRTSRIINFGYGAMGAMPGSLTVALFTAKGWNYWLAIAVGLALGLLIGGLVEFVVIRRFAKSSRLVLTVATIGLAQVLGGIGLILLVWMGADLFIGNIETPISGSFFVRPYQVRGDHILMLSVAPLVMAGMGWFLLRTSAGIAVRGAADDEDRALLLGIPVRRLQTLVWVMAGGLSTITFITKAPFTGVVSDAIVGPGIILPGLAVAVVARFESFPIAFFTGIGLGIAEWTIRWNITAESIFDVTFLVVILVALLTRKEKPQRGREDDAFGVKVLRAIPRELRDLPEVRWPRIAFGVAIALLAVFMPLGARASSVLLMSFALLWGMVAVSLVVLTGWGGHISLGQFAIVGVGAMAAGNLVMRWNLDLLFSLVVATLAGAAVAALIGMPALRIKGLYLAVTTMAFAVALDSYFLNPVNFASFVPDRIDRPVLFKRFDMESEWVTYYTVLTALVVVLLLVRGIRGSRPGRAVIAVRDNERNADALAVPTTRVKLAAFVLSGSIAGLAGGLYLVVLSAAGQGTFQPNMSFEVFSMAVIGGLGSVPGALLGVFTFRWLQTVLSANVRLLLTGTGLLVILYFLPGGLGEFVQLQRDRYLRWVADRRSIIVPSLVADARDERDSDEHAEDETDVISGALSGGPTP